MRTIKALSSADYDAYLTRWTALVAGVCGMLLFALASNLFLMTWLRSPFQRWYVAWLISGIFYTLCWSGAVNEILPALDGSWRVRANVLLASFLVGSATGFFFDFVETGKLPSWLITAGRWCAGLIIGLGVLASADQFFPARTFDLLLNIAFLASILLISVGLAYAIRRDSRTVWFYLAAWVAPMIVFMLRVARNFELVGHSDIVDMATPLALAFESAILSLAIADRFRDFMRQRDAAQAEHETLRRVASTDGLTGLANRAAFQQKMNALDEQVGADLLIIDLDDLKVVNDTAGHDAGDAVIVEAGRRLQRVLRGKGLIARLGGDELAVLLVGAERVLLPELLREVDNSGKEKLAHGSHMLSLRVSGGLASWNGGSGSPERLYKEADLALYRAKAEGRGCWRAYSTAIGADLEDRRAWIAQGRQALERSEFELHLQPIVDLSSKEVHHYEALLRWHHPTRGLLSPGAFASLFDDLELGSAVQEHVLSMAFDVLANSLAVRAAPHTVSVNFLTCQLNGQPAAQRILRALAIRGLPPSALIVEVTENVVLGRPAGPVIECLRHLRLAGLGVSLDDFGTGYASLVHLRDLPADVLKIDRSFIAGLAENSESTKIVRAIVSLAHNLGRKVVAEGVETEKQLQFLERLGCDWGQGYLLGRPERNRLALPSHERAA
jgi:diguanylate cyclase (GGDEF)-like protein